MGEREPQRLTRRTQKPHGFRRGVFAEKVVNVKQKTLRWNVHGKCYDIYQNYYITFSMFLLIFLFCF